MFESVVFPREVKILIFREKRQFFELTTKKISQNFLRGKSENFPEKSEIFSVEIGFFLRIHDPQTSNQIDTAASYYTYMYNI